MIASPQIAGVGARLHHTRTTAIFTRRNVRILSLLGAAAFAGAWNFTFLAPILPEVADSTDVSVTAAGQLVTVSAGVTVIALIALGPLSDRYGRRTMLVAGLLSMGLAALGSAMTSSFAILMALRIFSGIADALVLPSSAAAVGDYFHQKDREVALNVLLLPLGAAAVIGLPAVVVITEIANWHVAFLALGLFNLAAAAGIRLLLPYVATARRTTTLGDHYRESYGELLRSRAALTILAASVLGAAVWNGMVTYAGALFEDEVGVNGTQLTFIFGGLGLSYVIGGAAGVALSRRLPARAIALASAVCASVLLLPFVSSTEAAIVCVIFGMLFAASRAPGIAALNNMLLDAAPNAQGTAVSSYGVVAACGILMGAALGGTAIELWGFVGMGVIFTGLALLSVLLLARPLEAESLEPTAAA
jgi:predicted MFS family arabinose efflux permease